MNLYYVTTKGHFHLYVVAEDPTKAKEKVDKYLKEQDYGFYDARIVTEIKLLAESTSKRNINNSGIMSIIL